MKTCNSIPGSRTSANGWPTPARSHHHSRTRSLARPEEPCSTSSSPAPHSDRADRTRAHAAKGFGAGFGNKLPSFLGGKKDGAPSGGVAPAPPIELNMPEDLSQMWAIAQDEWRTYCVENPVVLASGARIHLVPVGADLPGDAALIRDVVEAVRPDAIALESPPQHLKSYTSMAKALEPLLARTLASDLASPSAARACLSRAQREDLQLQLLAACRGASLKPDPDQFTHLFRLGSLPFAEWLIPAHLVRTQPPPAAAGAAAAPPTLPMLLLSCGLDREARAAAPAASLYLGREFDVYLEEVEAALGEEVLGEMEAWRAGLGDRLEGAGGAGRELATLLAAWETQCCLGPEEQRVVAARVEERMTAEAKARGQVVKAGGSGVALDVVRTAGDPYVAKRLVELAAGKDVVRKCGTIVAVVGRVHCLNVEAELKKLAAA